MGSSTSTRNSLKRSVQKHSTVYFRFRGFEIAGVPRKPSNWANRIDERTWNEFISYCQSATTSTKINALKSQYQSYQCRQAMPILPILFAALIDLVIFTNDPSVTLILIAFGITVICIIGGWSYFRCVSSTKRRIKLQFLQNVRRNLLSHFATLNRKYVNQIQFDVPEISTGAATKSGPKALAIDIAIWGNVKRVQYIPDAPSADVVQKQMRPPPSQPNVPNVRNVPIRYMAVMPDGRMVPAPMAQPPPQVQYQAVHGLKTQGQPPVQYQPVPAQGQPVPPVQYQAVEEHVRVHIEPQVELQKVVPPAYNPEHQHVAPGSEPNAVPIPSAPPGLDDDEPSAPVPRINDDEVALIDVHDTERYGAGGEGGGEGQEGQVTNL